MFVFDILKYVPSEFTGDFPVITDGKVLFDSLTALNLSEKDLQKALGKTKVSDVFLMTMDRNKKTNIVKMRDSE